MERTNLDTGMYIIDKGYQILNLNQAMHEMYPEVKVGDICYRALALQEAPCPTCPLVNNDVLFFNPFRKEWISANAAQMEYPDHGECYNVQFKMRKNIGGTKAELIRMEQVDEHLADLKTATGKECVIGGYREPGAPLFFANENMVELLGYETIEEMAEGIDGLVINIVHPDDRERVNHDIECAKKEGETFETMFRIPQKDGSWIWTVTRGKLVKTLTGKLATLAVCSNMANFLDLHDALQEENQELLEKGQQTESMMEQIPGCYHRCAADEGYSFLHISKSFEETVGWTKEEIAELFDNKFINLVYPEDIPLFDGLVDGIERNGSASTIYRIKNKEYGYRWVQDSTMLVTSGDESFYQCTFADITEYVEELEMARRRAESSNRAKSTFLFNLSHDIRTPMNAIHGFTQMLKKNPTDSEFVREVVGKIDKSSDTLNKLLSDVLELSRIESGKESVDCSVVDLTAFSDNVTGMLSKEIEQAGVTFTVENKITDNFVLCDELKLTQITMNMLSNAKKFTPAGGRIVFGIEQLSDAEQSAAEYRFYVKDTGIGMSEEFLARAFEQFERERTATESGVGGSGLGLSIIKKLTELLGGSYALESKLGEGTEISATMRLEITKAVEKEEMPTAAEGFDFTGKRVLLVEDNEFNREIARFVLEGCGLYVEEAEDGAKAVNRLMTVDAGYFDLVLMDIQMPVMDGYTATAEIRCIPDTKLASIPIIAMTANAFKEDQERCIEVGMNGHISKPIDTNVLLNVLRDILGGSMK